MNPIPSTHPAEARHDLLFVVPRSSELRPPGRQGRGDGYTSRSA